MILTEDEAREKWCPFARYSMASEPSCNRLNVAGAEQGFEADFDDGVLTCIGSRCMAWRWYGIRVEGKKPTLGYCGLAGKAGIPP